MEAQGFHQLVFTDLVSSINDNLQLHDCHRASSCVYVSVLQPLVCVNVSPWGGITAWGCVWAGERLPYCKYSEGWGIHLQVRS